MAVKMCSRCAEWLPATPDYFSRNRTEPDGPDYYCKACRSRIAAYNYRRHRAAIRAQQAEYAQRRREAVR